MVPGQVRTPQQGAGIALTRVIVMAVTFVLVAYVGILIELPVGIAALLAGLAAFLQIAGGSLFEVVSISCPDCGRREKVVRNTGSFECPQCGKELFIFYGKVTEKEKMLE